MVLPKYEETCGGWEPCCNRALAPSNFLRRAKHTFLICMPVFFFLFRVCRFPPPPSNTQRERVEHSTILAQKQETNLTVPRSFGAPQQSSLFRDTPPNPSVTHSRYNPTRESDGKRTFLPSVFPRLQHRRNSSPFEDRALAHVAHATLSCFTGKVANDASVPVVEPRAPIHIYPFPPVSKPQPKYTTHPIPTRIIAQPIPPSSRSPSPPPRLPTLPLPTTLS